MRKKAKALRQWENLQKQRRRCVEAAVAGTALSPKEAALQIEEARKRLGIDYHQYREWRLFDVPAEEQASYVETKRAEAEQAKQQETAAREAAALATGWEKEQLDEAFKAAKEMTGCTWPEYARYRIYDMDASAVKTIYTQWYANRIARKFNTDPKLEEKIRTVGAAAAPDDDLTVIHIVTVTDVVQPVTKDGDFAATAYAAMQTAGVTAAVDPQTGLVISDGADTNGNKAEVHPVSRIPLRGFAVPGFEEALRMVHTMQLETGIHGFLDWTFALKEDEPVLTGIDAAPDAQFLSLPYAGDAAGKKDVMIRFLYENPGVTPAARRSRRQAAAKKAEDNDAYYTEKIAAATGWDPVLTRARVDASGMWYRYYYTFRYWELSDEMQRNFLTQGVVEALQARYNRSPKDLRIFMRKDLFAGYYREFLGRPFLATNGMTEEVFRDTFKDFDRVIYKPLGRFGGHGVEVFSIKDLGVGETCRRICEKDPGILEGYLTQHSDMLKMFPNAVNTVRIVTMRTKEGAGGMAPGAVDLLFSTVRFGRGEQVVDNMSSGGIAAAVDLATGTVVTNAMDLEGRVYYRHPDTQKMFKGFQIPFYQEAKALVMKAAQQSYGFYGWDIAITKDGPVIIECNTKPGSQVIQGPWLSERVGLRPLVEKYMTGQEDPFVIVLARRHTTGLSAIEAVGKAGYTVDLIASASRTGQAESLRESKYIRNSVEVVTRNKSEDDPDLLRAIMAYRGEASGKQVLIPTDTYTASVVNRYKPVLSEFFLIPGDNDSELQTLPHAEVFSALTPEQRKARKKQMKHIGSVTAATGWSPKQAEEKMRTANETIGISYSDYDQYNFWQYEDPGTQKEKYALLISRRKRIEEARAQQVNGIARALGVSKEEAATLMEEAVSRFGITHAKYYEFGLYRYSTEEQEEILARI